MPRTFSKTEQIRDLAQAVLIELGATQDGQMRETMLIRNGNYCGHRYRLEEFEAVWFIEEDELKFSSQTLGTIRKLVASQALAERESRHRQRAAA